MPLTFAHPAAVLAFSRESKYFHFPALVLGSMAPDFEYFLRCQPHSEFGHTYAGFLFFNLPLVVIVYSIYLNVIQPALSRYLPFWIQSSDKKEFSNRGVKMLIFFLSALIGMLTHVVWDSFTHPHGAMVMRFSVLAHPFHSFGYAIPLYKFLQHGSTLLGIGMICGYLIRHGTKQNKAQNKKMRYWLSIQAVTVCLFGVWYTINYVSLKSYGIAAVRLIDSCLISSIAVSLYFRSRIKTGKANL